MPVAARERLTALVEDLGGQAGVARALQVDRSRVSRWLRDQEPDADNRVKLEAVEFVLARLRRTYRHDTALKWLYGVNAHLGDRRPVDLLGKGRVAEVLAALEADELGSYA